MREFGTRDAGKTYRPRPGSYVVVFDPKRQVAVLRTAKGVTLAGGGADPGETAEATLRREVVEECGYEIEIVRPLGRAVEYVDAGAEGCFAKECTFFEGRFGRRLTSEVEPDHRLVWLSARSAAALLTHGSHAWAVERALEAT